MSSANSLLLYHALVNACENNLFHLYVLSVGVECSVSVIWHILRPGYQNHQCCLRIAGAGWCRQADGAESSPSTRKVA